MFEQPEVQCISRSSSYCLCVTAPAPGELCCQNILQVLTEFFRMFCDTPSSYRTDMVKAYANQCVLADTDIVTTSCRLCAQKPIRVQKGTTMEFARIGRTRVRNVGVARATVVIDHPMLI